MCILWKEFHPVIKLKTTAARECDDDNDGGGSGL
jgi:hypothetical protein